MSGPAVVVIDPLSFYDELVRDRYANWISPRDLRNRDAFVLVLAVLAAREQPQAAGCHPPDGPPGGRALLPAPGVRLQVRPFQRPDR